MVAADEQSTEAQIMKSRCVCVCVVTARVGDWAVCVCCIMSQLKEVWTAVSRSRRTFFRVLTSLALDRTRPFVLAACYSWRRTVSQISNRFTSPPPLSFVSALTMPPPSVQRTLEALLDVWGPICSSKHRVVESCSVPPHNDSFFLSCALAFVLKCILNSGILHALVCFPKHVQFIQCYLWTSAKF